MLAGLKHFGQRGFKGTTVAMLEAETGFTRGSFFTYYKNMSEILEATINRYYFNWVTACSVPEEYRESLRDFYTKLVSMYETECIEMLGKGVKHLAKIYKMFWSALTGHILDASIKGNICYTDCLAYQMDNIYKLMSKPTSAL